MLNKSLLLGTLLIVIGAEKIDWKLLGVEIPKPKQQTQTKNDKNLSEDINVIIPQKYYYKSNDIYTQPRDIRYFRYSEYICPTYK